MLQTLVKLFTVDKNHDHILDMTAVRLQCLPKRGKQVVQLDFQETSLSEIFLNQITIL